MSRGAVEKQFTASGDSNEVGPDGLVLLRVFDTAGNQEGRSYQAVQAIVGPHRKMISAGEQLRGPTEHPDGVGDRSASVEIENVVLIDFNTSSALEIRTAGESQHLRWISSIGHAQDSICRQRQRAPGDRQVGAIFEVQYCFGVDLKEPASFVAHGRVEAFDAGARHMLNLEEAAVEHRSATQMRFLAETRATDDKAPLVHQPAAESMGEVSVQVQGARAKLAA